MLREFPSWVPEHLRLEKACVQKPAYARAWADGASLDYPCQSVSLKQNPPPGTTVLGLYLPLPLRVLG